MTTSPDVRTLHALLAHDVKNALGVLEQQLAELAQASRPELAREAHAQCVALRQRLVMMLTLLPAHDLVAAPEDLVSDTLPACRKDDPLPVLRTEESPIDFLCSVQRRTPRPRRDAELSVGACVAAPPVWTFDAHLVRLALDAALHNAWRFARRHVHLDAFAEDGHLVFTVTDDGPGPSPDTTRGTGSDAASTGLGTALCEAVARAHGTPERPGLARVMPVPGGGARFELWLA